jgi:hypothetical protein
LRVADGTFVMRFPASQVAQRSHVGEFATVLKRPSAHAVHVRSRVEDGVVAEKPALQVVHEAHELRFALAVNVPPAHAAHVRFRVGEGVLVA